MQLFQSVVKKVYLILSESGPEALSALGQSLLSSCDGQFVLSQQNRSLDSYVDSTLRVVKDCLSVYYKKVDSQKQADLADVQKGTG